MAYRKVEEASLTSVANAIREKSGTTDVLSFPNEFVSAINEISAGGGLPSGITAIASGTFTPASDTDGEFIPHGLGVTPTFVYYHAEGEADIDDFSGYVVGATISTIPIAEASSTIYGNTLYSYGKPSTYSGVAWVTDYAQYTAEDAVAEYLINDTGFAIGSNFGTPAKAGVTYKWVAVAME